MVSQYPNLDADLHNADWTKQGKDAEFMKEWAKKLRNETRVENALESGKISESRVVKGEPTDKGSRTYWLMKGDQVLASVVAFTDEEAESYFNDLESLR